MSCIDPFLNEFTFEAGRILSKNMTIILAFDPFKGPIGTLYILRSKVKYLLNNQFC